MMYDFIASYINTEHTKIVRKIVKLYLLFIT